MSDPTTQPVTPEQAVAIFGQLVAQTPAVPAQVDLFREAVAVLVAVVTERNQAAAANDGG
jgi:hypothetical protein